MKAAVYNEYGSADVIRIENVETPRPGAGEVLVRIRASTVGTWDAEARAYSFPLWFGVPLRLVMGLRRPRWPILGQELAGEVAALGEGVEHLR